MASSSSSSTTPPPGQAVPRGYLDALIDRLVGWKSDLPSERSSYTILPVRIPMDDDDDVSLAADVYQPVLTSSSSSTTTSSSSGSSQQPPQHKTLGTIVVIGPYGRRFPFSITLARIWASRGYTVLFVSSRGTFDSSGTFAPGIDEGKDCPAVIQWMRQQAWYTGRFATFGMSYLGYTQWSIMAARYDSPRYNYSDAEKRAAAREHAAAVVLVGPHNFADLVWGTGAMWLAAVDWAGATQTMGQKGIARAMWDMVQLTRNPDGDVETKRGVPLLTAVERRFEEGSTLAWLREHVKGSREQIQGERAREYWRRMDQSRALETTEVPVLLVGGWVDVFVRETVKQWRRLDERGVTVGLTMGGRSHADADQDMREMFDWFETHLAQKPDAKRRPARARVQVMTTGPDANKDEWKWFSSWPPANIQPVHLGLAADGQLLFPSDTPSQTKTTTDTASFTFDPHHPTPTYGGDLLFGGGYVDDSALADRSDVLAFTTPPLSRSVEIHGRPRIELLHRSDNPHVDLFIRLCGVEFKSGTAVSRNICQAYQRLDPQRGVGASGGGKTTVKVVLELSDCAHRFHAGTAIRVVVAGGNFPHYSVNLGTGEAQATGTVMRPATHTVVLGEKEGSRLVLPVLTVE